MQTINSLDLNREISADLLQASLKEVQDKLNAQKHLLKGCNHEISEAHAEKAQITKDVSDTQLQIQELEHKVSKCNKDTNDAAKLVHKSLLAFMHNGSAL